MPLWEEFMQPQAPSPTRWAVYPSHSIITEGSWVRVTHASSCGLWLRHTESRAGRKTVVTYRSKLRERIERLDIY